MTGGGGGMVLAVFLLILAMVVAAELWRSGPAGPRPPARPPADDTAGDDSAADDAAGDDTAGDDTAGDDTECADDLDRAEALCTALLFAGVLSMGEYRSRMARLASLEAARHPAFTPPRP
jgi:hypothetical protein